MESLEAQTPPKKRSSTLLLGKETNRRQATYIRIPANNGSELAVTESSEKEAWTNSSSQMLKQVHGRTVGKDTAGRISSTGIASEKSAIEASSGEEDCGYDVERMFKELKIAREKKKESGITGRHWVKKEIQEYHYCRSCGQGTLDEDRCAACRSRCTLCGGVIRMEGCCDACRTVEISRWLTTLET